jgi:hypothetical protein
VSFLTDDNEESFKFWMALEPLKKGQTTAPEDKRWVQGIASTDHKDLHGEHVNQEGIDTSYFINNGYFNYDHKSGAENKVGEPTECKVTPQGLWVKGFIYKEKKMADFVWEHINSLSKSGARRRMGFSIEGRVLKESGAIIERCWIQDIAITPAPVNSSTWAEIAKSLNARQWATQNVVSKGLSFSQAVEFIKEQEGLDEHDATTLATLIFQSIRG